MHLCGMCVYFSVYLYVYCVSMCVYFLCICISHVYVCICAFDVCVFSCVCICVCVLAVCICVFDVCVFVCVVCLCLFVYVFPTQLMHGLLSFSVVEQDGFLSENQWNCFLR